MLKAFEKALLKVGRTGDGANGYHYSFLSIKQKLDRTLVHIGHIGKVNQDRHIKENLT